MVSPKSGPQSPYARKMHDLVGLTYSETEANHLYSRILSHQKSLATALGRKVPLRAAALDYLEHASELPQPETVLTAGSWTLTLERVDAQAWDHIADMREAKELIERKIILPLKEPELTKKHGVVPPKAIILFGPPGTGKTTFAKGIAGRLGWSFIDVHASELAAEGRDLQAVRLKEVLEVLRGQTNGVIFFDEFEELASLRPGGDKASRAVTNEFLKQLPRLREYERILVVCATNHVRHLDPALLRPGRFDYVLPMGTAGPEARERILERFLGRMRVDPALDRALIVERTERFTPADLELVCMRVAQRAFEREYFTQQDYRATTEDFFEILRGFRPTLTEEMLRQFQEDIERHARW